MQVTNCKYTGMMAMRGIVGTLPALTVLLSTVQQVALMGFTTSPVSGSGPGVLG